MKNKNINISDFEINFNLPNDLNNNRISDFLNDWYELTKKEKLKKLREERINKLNKINKKTNDK